MFSGYSESGSGSQERGPTTFTFQPPGVVESRPAEGQAVPVQGGMKGQAVVGNTAQSINLDSGGTDQTIQALLKFSGDMLAPHIKAAKEEQFVTGMQRAASGEALTEIINEQPWYTKIFGDGPLVEGARAYEVDAKANKWATFHEENMDKLRTQSPDSIPKYLVESMNQHLTGDPATDTLIKANMIKVAPSLIKRQTKEHYKFLQERTSEQRSNAMLAAGDRLVSMRKDSAGMYSNEDFDNAEADLLAVSTPTEGADPKAFWHDFKAVLGVQAEKGNFHAINAYAKAGVFTNIPIAERAPLERQLNQFQAYHASQAADQYSEQIARIKFAAHNVGPNGGPLISAEEVNRQFDAINADYTAKTGNPAPIVHKAEKVSTMVTSAQAVVNAQRAAQKTMAKEQDLVVLGSLVDSQINQGNYAGARKQGTIPQTDVDERFYNLYKANPDVKLLVSNAAQGYGDEGVNPQVRRDLAGLMQSSNIGTIGPNFVQGYAQWKSMYTTPNGGAEVAPKYFTNQDHLRLLAFDRALQGRPMAEYGEMAYQSTLKVRMDPGHSWSNTEKVEVDSLIKKRYPSAGPDAQQLIADAMAREMGGLKHNSLKPIGDSINSAAANGLEVAGKYAWHTEGLGAGIKPLRSFLAEPDGSKIIADDQIDYVFNQTVANLTGPTQIPRGEIKATRIWRAADANGEAVFHALVTDDKDQVFPIRFTSGNILAEHRRNVQRKQDKIPSTRGDGVDHRLDAGGFGKIPINMNSGLSQVLTSQ